MAEKNNNKFKNYNNFYNKKKKDNSYNNKKKNNHNQYRNKKTIEEYEKIYLSNKMKDKSEKAICPICDEPIYIPEEAFFRLLVQRYNNLELKTNFSATDFLGVSVTYICCPFATN